MIKHFLPVSKKDIKQRGWDQLDIILITGDAYIDHPSFGAAVIGRVLENEGFRVGIIAQPDWRSLDDFIKLGRPRLFFGITAGNQDSMVANYTANKRLRKKDDYSPGGKTGLRPDRATLVYSHKVREAFKDAFIVLGGIEASMRRIAHYDYWDNKIRRSVLLDAKADILVYGMGEKAVIEIAKRLDAFVDKDNKVLYGINGTVTVHKEVTKIKEFISLPSFEEVSAEKDKFNKAYNLFYYNLNPFKSKILIQEHEGRYIVQYPPSPPLSEKEFDRIFALPFKRECHPRYKREGVIKAFDTVKNSIISNRGCIGACNFCTLYIHQGAIIQSRSENSILQEIKTITKKSHFKGTISDIGGPTVNLYKANCKKWHTNGLCKNRSCISPTICRNLRFGYDDMIELLVKAKSIPRIKHVFLSSGFRYDLLLNKPGRRFMEFICRENISGQMRIAPEHVLDKMLNVMNKGTANAFKDFLLMFAEIIKKINKKIYLVHYLLMSHPGETLDDSIKLSLFLMKNKIYPEQIQDYIPSPLTMSSCMYYTEKDPISGDDLYVAKTFRERKMHRAIIQYKNKNNGKTIKQALEIAGRQDIFWKFKI